MKVRAVKGVITYLTILCMLIANITTAFAALGPVDRIGTPLPNWQEKTPLMNIFKIAGSDKEFIMLDTGKEDGSKFLVMAKNDYGKHVFDPAKGQRFDPKDSKNIAYWLNNDFKSAGNGENLKLPDGIISHIDFNHAWMTEGGTPSGNCSEDYEVTAGIVLLSQEEYKKYYTKFGLRDKMPKNEGGWWLRTGRGIGGGGNTILVCKVDDASIGQTHQWNSESSVLVRPVFYLDKEFFTSVKLDTATLGSSVKRTILATYKPEELKAAGYSDEELDMLKDVSSEVSEKINVTFDNALGNIVSPQDAKFNVEIMMSGTKPKNYTVECEIPDSGMEFKPVNVMAQPKVKKVQTVTLSGIKNGIYNLNVTVRAGDRIAKEEKLKFSVVPAYTPQFMDDMTKRGFATHFSDGFHDDENVAKLLNRSGVRFIRDGMLWNHFEKQKGVFDFTETDDWFIKRTKEGISVLATLAFGNTLYSSDPKQDKMGPKTKEEIDAFCNFVEKTLRKYPQIRIVELWNEPNIRTFWRPDPNVDDYTNLVKAVSAVIRKIDPEIQLYVGSTSGTANKFIGDIFARGAFPYVDGVSFHPYIAPNAVDNGYKTALDSVDTTILKYGGWKDRSITEVGWSTANTGVGVSLEKEATEIVKQFVVSDSAGIKSNAFYTFRNTGIRPEDKEDQFGIIYKEDLSAKPAFIALSQMNQKLGGAQYLGEIKLSENLKTHLYQKDGLPLLVMWATQGEEDYDFGGEAIRAEDMNGNPIQGTDIKIGQKPVYVAGIGNAWMNKAASYTIGQKYEALIKKWDKKLTDENIKNNIKKLFEYSKGLGSNDALPSEEEVSEKLALHFAQGTQLIKALGSGQSPLTDVETMQFLHEFFGIGQCWGGLYAFTVNPAQVPADLVSKPKLDSIKTLIDNRLKDTPNDVLPFSQEIMRHAKEYSKNAEIVKNKPESNKAKAGVVKNWDRMSVELSNWVEQLAAFEKNQNISLQMQVSSADASVFINTQKVIKPSITNFSANPAVGKLKLFDESGKVISESKDVKVESGKSLIVELPILIEAVNKTGKANCVLKFMEGDKTINGIDVDFTVQTKFDMGLVPSNTTLKELKEVKVKLKNLFDSKITGQILVEPPKDWSLKEGSKSFAVDPSNELEVSFPVDKTTKVPFNIYNFNVTINDSQGKLLLKKTVPLSFTTVVKNSTPMDPAGFDGNISNWSDAYPVYLNPPADAGSVEEWRGADMAGMIFTKWDDGYLYIMSSIGDNYFSQTKFGAGIWDGDCLQMSFDTKNSKAKSYDADDYEYGAALGASGCEVFAWKAAEGHEANEKPAKWVNILRDPQKNITRYMIRIPKDELSPMQFKEGYNFGLNFCLDDADYSDREKMTQLTSGTGDTKNTSFYYTWVLKPSEAPASMDLMGKYSLPVDLTITGDTGSNQTQDEQSPAPVNSSTPQGITVKIDGEVQKYDQEPAIINDRTLVPLRGIFEKLGASVEWEEATRTVKAVKNDIKIVLVIGESSAKKNDTAMTLDQPAVVINDRTMVPVRFVSEALGANVSFDEKTNTVNITTTSANK